MAELVDTMRRGQGRVNKARGLYKMKPSGTKDGNKANLQALRNKRVTVSPGEAERPSLGAGIEQYNKGYSQIARANALVSLREKKSGGSAALTMSARDKAKYQKATKSHNAAAAKRASDKPSSDGMTDAHARFSKGKTVQVGAYRTVTKK